MKSVITILVLALVVAVSVEAQAPEPVGDQFQVNSYTTGYQGWYGTDVAMAGNGDFVVVWANGSYNDPQSDYSIQGQRFAANGSPQGDEFQVNSYDTGSQVWPAMAVGPGGEFVVVWSSFGSYSTDTSYYSIQGRRFAANGTPQGSDFLVNTYTTASQWTPAVEIGPDGDFVVVWTSSGSDGTDTDGSVQGQRFAANGSPQGDEFQVNSYTTGRQGGPVVTANIQGDFVVAWTSNGSDGTDTSSYSALGQRFASNGSPQGDEFQVNSYTTGFQGASGVAADANGNFVVIWGSNGSDGTDTSYRSIQGQRMIIPGVFSDGFESGGTTAWSSTVP